MMLIVRQTQRTGRQTDRYEVYFILIGIQNNVLANVSAQAILYLDDFVEGSYFSN